MKNVRAFVLLTAVTLLLPARSMASTISLNNLLTNASFEGGLAGGCPVGWTCTNFGVVAPTAAQYPYNSQNGLASPAFVPNGTKAAFTPVAGSDTGKLQQTIAGQHFEAGNTYELVFWVGNPLGGAFLSSFEVQLFLGSSPASATSNVLCDSPSRNLAYSTTPIGGSTLSGFENGQPCKLNFPNFGGYLPADGDWQKYTVSFTTNASYMAEDIGVVFNVFPASAAENGGLMHLDLNAPAAGTFADATTPEPATLMLLGTGLAFVMARARKRKR